MLNGDYLWNNYLKKQQNQKKGHKNNAKISGHKAKNPAANNRIGNMKVMDIRQLLSYTKDRLDFYSSQHSEKLQDFEDDINQGNNEIRRKVDDAFNYNHNDDINNFNDQGRTILKMLTVYIQI